MRQMIPKKMIPKKLPILEASLKVVGSKGPCLFRSVALVLDVPWLTFCVGTHRAATPEEQAANPEASKTPFLHAWAEWKDIVFAPTTMEMRGGQLVPMDKARYYELNGTRDVKTLSRAELKKLSDKYGFKRYITKGEPLKENASFGDVILKRMGIPYVVSRDGGLVPAPVRRGEGLSESISMSGVQRDIERN